MEEGSIAKSVRGCLELFQALSSISSSLSNTSDQAALMAIAEEEPRFKVWSGNMGAHSTGRRSLQYRLRDASHLQNQVLALLKDLSELLEDCSDILQGRKVPWDQVEDDKILADELDLLEDDSNDSELPTTEMEQIASNVPDTINCLLRLSVAIRNPAPHDRFVAAVPIDESHYESFDIQHVQAKFPKIDSFLAQRLGKAISRRRHYFRYRESHHSKLSHGLDLIDQADGKSTIASSIPGYAKDTGMNNALSAINEDAVSDSGISQTSFASSVADTEGIRIPPLPKSAESGPFECPFCYMIIIAANRTSWIRHVFADLRPYVCLSEDCTAAEKWFTRRHEWILHEIENHWKFYVCPQSCGQSFQSRSKCAEHIHKCHPDTIPENQFEAVVSLSARSIQVENGILCPICQERLESVKKYQRHVGRHQEQLAIFALPSTESLDDKEDLDDDESNSSRSDPASKETGAADGGIQLEELNDDDENPIRRVEVHVSPHEYGFESVNEDTTTVDDQLYHVGDGEMNRRNLSKSHFLSSGESDHSQDTTSSSQRLSREAQRLERQRDEEEERLRRIRLRIAKENAAISASTKPPAPNEPEPASPIDSDIPLLEKAVAQHGAGGEGAGEEAKQRELENMRLRQEEEDRKDIERARLKADRMAWERIEAEKKAEEDRRRQHAEAMARAEEIARLRFQAEIKAAEEQSRREDEGHLQAEEAIHPRFKAYLREISAAKAADEKRAAEEAAIKAGAKAKAAAAKKAAEEAIQIEAANAHFKAALKADADANTRPPVGSSDRS
ncbi:hypothetical protein V8C35DRAFT_296599 [Trichoderma chlorosporum]